MNYKIETLRKDICDIINSCGVPVSAAYYVLKDVLLELEEFKNKLVQQEYEQIKTEEDKEKTEEE